MTESITVHGGLTATPELRYSQSGVAIVSGTVASTERYKDRQSGEWKDGKSLYLRFSAFKELAENIAASNLAKGAQVFVTGKLHTRQYEDRDGQKRTSVELDVVDFGVSLRRATAQVTRTASAAPQAPSTWDAAQAPAEPWGGSYGDDTPF